MDALSSFIPVDRRLALDAGTPLSDLDWGAVLFADISGFTPLTATLSHELGPRRGAEELTRQLDHVYGALHAEVWRYGGSLIGFSGDAITCWFSAGADDAAAIAGAAHRALTCAVAMQAVIGRLTAVSTPAGVVFSLGVKVAVAAGPVRRLTVGDPRVQVSEVLAGAIMDRVAAAEQLAARGEVLAAAEVVAALGSIVDVESWRDGDGGPFAAVAGLAPAPAAPWPAPAPSPTEVARNWVHPAVYERLRSGGDDFLGELRLGTPLFLKFGGLDYDGDAGAGAQLDAFIRWVQQVVARYEGTLLQVTMGDKGSYCYAVFGAPIAHEDDALRAVAAAAELSEPPPELASLGQPRIGLSHGRIYSGAYGAADRRTYGALGREVNVAARLMGLAQPGQVLVTEPLAAAVRHAYVLQSRGAQTLKGQPEPVTIYAVLGRKSAAAGVVLRRGRAPLVGREAERARIALAVAQLQAGQGATLLLEGEAGIGKSRLLEEALARAEAAGIAALDGAANAIDRATPYFAWRPVFARLFELGGLVDDPTPGSREQWREQVLARLAAAPELARLAPLLNAVLPLDLPDNELTAQMAGELRANSTAGLLVELLRRRAAAAPLLIALEDAHWLDSASWGVARQAQAEVAPLLLVISLRPLREAQPPAYAQISSAPGAELLRLDTMAPPEVEALVCQRLGVDALPAPVRRLILDKAEGHPFFSEELAYALRDAGLIVVTGRSCALAPGVRDLQAFDFPDTIQGVITSRVDRLPPAQQLTLKVASVIGRVFAYATLHAIYPVQRELAALLDQLAALTRVDLTLPEAVEPELIYIFKHVTAQEAVYSLLLSTQRQQLHHAVARWYEEARGDDLAPYYTFLAHHWGRAGVPTKAAHYMELAGEQALRGGAYQEAVRHFEELLELAAAQGEADSPRITRSRWKLGEAYFRLGQLATARALMEQALARLDRPVPTTPAAMAAQTLREIGLQLLHRLRPARVLGRASAQERERLLEIATIYQNLSILYYFEKALGLNMYASLRQVNVSEPAGASLGLAQAYATLCIITGIFAMRPLAELYDRLARRVADALPAQPYAKAYVIHSTSLYRHGIAQSGRVRADLSYALAIYRQLGDRANWRDALVVLTSSEYTAGRFAHADELVRQIPPAASDDDRAPHLFWSIQWRCGLALRRGETQAARELLRAGEPFLGRGTEGLIDVAYYGLLAEALLDSDPAGARQAAGQALAIITKGRGVPLIACTLDGYRGAAEALVTLWERAAAAGQATRALRREARRACAFLHTFRLFLPMGEPVAWLYQGRCDWLDGRRDRAMAAWQRAAATAARRDMPLEQGLAHAAIARHLPPGDPLRELHMGQARVILAELGVHHDLQPTTEAHGAPGRLHP